MQCLTSVISATKEAEIRWIMVLGQPKSKVSESPSQPVSQAWLYIPAISAMQEA
jgi:hypothetical protein